LRGIGVNANERCIFQGESERFRRKALSEPDSAGAQPFSLWGFALTQEGFALDHKRAMSHRSGPILLVEDNPDTRNAVVALLELKGLAVVTATGGAEAIRRLEAGLRPSVMLVDLMLPEVTGWDVLQHLREEPELREIPTVVITAFPRETLRVVADAVLHKPFDYDRLINTVLGLIEPGSGRSS
jgi:CheY-like chemotaxis protein